MSNPSSLDPPFDPPYITIETTPQGSRRIEVLANGEKRNSPLTSFTVIESKASPTKTKPSVGGNAQASLLLNVPFNEKDEAKRLGARWNPSARKWYVPHGTDIQLFVKWWPKELQQTPE